MPRFLDPQDRNDVLVLAMNDLLLTEGFPGLTLRKIAARSEVSVGAILNNYGSREALLRIGAISTAGQRYTQVWLREPRDGVLAFLPAGEADLPLARCWLEWVTLSRNVEALHHALTFSLTKERSLLQQVTGIGGDALEGVEALVHGLLVAICRPVDAMPLGRARETLAAQVSNLLSPGRTDPPAPGRAAASGPSGAPVDPSARR